MDDGDAFRHRLEHEKRSSVAHLLVRCGRLVNEEALRRVRTDPRFASARAAHLTLFPHLDLDGTRLAELARRLEVSKQAVSQLVDDLERLGGVERAPDPSDRRAKIVRFTPAGRLALFKGLEVLGEIEAEVLAELDPERRRALGSDLEQVVAALERLRAG